MHVTPPDTADSGDFAFRVLRGQLRVAGLQIDAAGWAEVPYVLRALKAEGRILSRFAFERLVMGDPARRFLMSADRRRIRAVPPLSTGAITFVGMAAAE
jgi:RNA:NAD 2'-phosphotransferase (TPT1/KptA family)